MNNDEIFRKFWANYQWPDPVPVARRLYHDDSGDPLCYTMEDLPGKYIQVTAEQYARASFGVRVIDGQLVELEPVRLIRKLQPSAFGTTCHPQDVAIIVQSSSPNQSWEKK